MKKKRKRILINNKTTRTRKQWLLEAMRIMRHNKKNKMNKLRINDYGKMRWVRKNFKRE